MARVIVVAAVLLLLLLHSAGAQPAALVPAGGPTNITHILDKAGQFTVIIRMMRSTHVEDQINNQLANTGNNGLTVFAPTDNAFASLPAGTLNSLSDQEKVELLQFHVLPNLVTMQQFQTVSNPLRTQAGGDSGRFALNVTASGSQVNISTGVDDTTVSNTLYSDSRLAVYQVDKVLMPLDIFRPPPPAPPPEMGDGEDDKKKGAASSADAPASADKTSKTGGADSSDGYGGRGRRDAGAMAAVAAAAASFFF